MVLKTIFWNCSDIFWKQGLYRVCILALFEEIFGEKTAVKMFKARKLNGAFWRFLKSILDDFLEECVLLYQCCHMCYTKGTAIMTYLYYLFEISEVTGIFSVVYANFFVITEMNDESSRSHLVIGITLECTNKNTGNVTKGKVTTATFYNFVLL